MKLSTIKRYDIIIEGRKRTELGRIEELAESIRENGVIAPVAVKTVGGKYKLLAGERRIRAMDFLEWEDIPARIYEENEDVDELKALIIELEENVRRKDLTPQEQCENVTAIHEAMTKKFGENKSKKPDSEGWSVRKTAALLNRKDYSHVAKEITIGRAMKVMPEIFCKAKTMVDVKKIFDNTKIRIEKATEAERIRKAVAETPDDILRKKLIDSFVVGDVKEKLKEIPDASFDFIELDPPYAIDLKKKKMLNSSVSREEQVKRYNEIDENEYQVFMEELFSEFYRILKKDRWLIVWFGQDPWYEYIKMWLDEAGFDVRAIAGIWVKSGGQVMNPKLDMASTYETFFYARKGQAFLNKEGRYNVFDYKPVLPSKKAYIGLPERPIDMMEDLLYTFVKEGSNILVPCCGGGNTMLAASNLACTSLGIDLSEENRDSFIIKVNSQKPGEYTSYA